MSDPNAHDSLLFDDDSFSRSRKYFWAINYLAELDISISENIVQLGRFVKTNKALQQQLTQLRYLRSRLRDQRNEAIALRDGVSVSIFFLFDLKYLGHPATIGFADVHLQLVIQCQRRNGESSFDSARRKYQALDIRQHLFLTAIVLRCMLAFSSHEYLTPFRML